MVKHKILIVEDSKLTTQIYKNILTEHGYLIDSCTNGNDAIRRVCSDFPPHLVLMDIDLEGTLDGVETAHHILKIKEIPVIFLTANSSKEIYERIKNVSCYGFILKGTDKYALLSTIETALRLADTTAQVSFSVASLEETQKIAQLGRWKLEHTTNSLSWSDTIYEIFEIEQQAFGATYEAFLDAIHPEDRELVDKAWKDSLENKTSYQITHRLLMEDGRVKWVDERCRTVFGAAGKPLSSVGIVQDITERKEAEIQIKKLSKEYVQVFHGTQDSMFLVEVKANSTFRYIRNNRMHQELTGIKTEDIQGKTPEELLGESLGRTISANYKRCVTNGGPLSYQETLDLPAGQRIWSTTLTPVYKNNQVAYIVGSSIDITAQKLVEQALRENEKKYRLIFERAPLGVLHFDENGHITDCNEYFIKIIGSSREKLIGIDMTKLPDQHVTEALRGALQGRITTYEGIYKSVTANKITPIKLQFAPIFFEDGFYGGVGIVEDITERIEAEKMLKERDNLLSRLSLQLPGAIYQYLLRPDGTSCFPFASNGIWDIYEVTPEEVKTDASVVSTRIHPDDYDQVMASINSSYNNLSVWENTHRVILPEKGLCWVRGLARPEKLPDGSVLWHGYLQNIDELKKAEDALQESEENYRYLIDNIHDIVYKINAGGIFTFVSPSWSLLLGHAEDQVVGKSFQLFVHPEDIPDCMAFLQKVMETGERQEGVEYRVKHADGSLVWHTSSATPMRDESGTTIGFLGTARDITERKKAEALLAHYHDLMKYVIEHTQSAVAVHDKELNYIYVSQRYLRDYRVKEHEIIGKHHYEVFPDLPQKWRDVHQRALAGEVISAEEDPYVQEDGKVDWTRWECRPWHEADGSIGGIIIYTEVITERKKMEQLIYFEKERLKTTLLSIGDGVIATDTKCNVVLMNPIAVQLTGWTQEEAFGRPLDEVFYIIHEYTRERCENPASKVLATGHMIELANHTVLIAKDGTEWPIEDSAAPIISDHSNGIDGVVLVFREVTEKRKKQAEIEFLSYYDQLTGLFNRRFFEKELRRLDTAENLPLTLAICDANGLKLANDAFGHEVGDKILIKLAEVMQKECRTNDIIARIGGDEFVIIMPKTNCNQAKKTISQLSESISREKVESIALSVSCGWDTKYDTDENITTVFRRAEDLMYRKKLSESKSIHYKTIEVINKALYEKNEREEKHSKRVSELCVALGIALNLSHDEINELRTVGLMHDIGKIAVDQNILNKPSTVDKLERLQIERHPEVGYQILSSVNEYAPLADYVLSHHERLDGKGYPRGLKGEEIPMQARILAIADAYDAMTSDRPYRKKLTKQAALNELKRQAGTQFDPVIIRVFLEKVIT